ncbi:hypothetical protein MASR2M70_20410 [Bacillota bacterium]
MMPQAILFTVIPITLYVIVAGLLVTYIFKEAKKRLPLYFYTAAALSTIFWAISRLLAILAPTESIAKLYEAAQLFFLVGFIASMIAFFVSRIYDNKSFNGAGVFFCIAILISAGLISCCFFISEILLSTYVYILIYSFFNFFVFFQRTRLFPELQISLDYIMRGVKDYVAVFDHFGKLIDMDFYALNDIIKASDVKDFTSFLELINKNSIPQQQWNFQSNCPENSLLEKEVVFEKEGQAAYYIFTANEIRNKGGDLIGTVCDLRDITEIKLLAIELDKKNKELEALNKELHDYVQVADSLSEEKERAQITREINSTIGQRLTEILSVLEVIKLGSEKDICDLDESVNAAIKGCRDVLSEVRIIVSQLIPEENRRVKQNAKDCNRR